MSDVTRGSSGTVRVSLEPHEKELLTNLIGEMRSLLVSEDAGDPSIKRLFPDAYDDADNARAFDELVHDQLKTVKIESLDAIERRLIDAPTISLDEDEVESWLAALTDMRLAIGTRLGVTEEMLSSDFDPSVPNGTVLAVMHWLGWMQESLVQVINP